MGDFAAMNKKENKKNIQDKGKRSFIPIAKKLLGIGLCGLLALTSASSITTLIHAKEDFSEVSDTEGTEFTTDLTDDTWIEQSPDVSRKEISAKKVARDGSNLSSFQTVHGEQDITSWDTVGPLTQYQVKSIQPDNVTVNLFNYKVNLKDEGNDLFPGPSTDSATWNMGINQGSLLLFGNVMENAGYWNIGSGAIRPWGKKNTNMKGIVQSTLNNAGYPQVDMENARKPLQNRTLIQSDNWGTGDLMDVWGFNTADDGAVFKAGEGWTAKGLSTYLLDNHNHDPDRESLQYLFDPTISVSNQEETETYKQSYRNVTNLFQIDNDGYYYYDARKNFAHFVDSSTHGQNEKPSDGTFVLYNSPAVVRTDGGYQCIENGAVIQPNGNNQKAALGCDNGVFEGEKSRGNFFPFNSPEDVYDQTARNAGNQPVLWSDDGDRVGNKIVVGSKENEDNAVRADHHMGMTVEVDFSQPINGLVNRGSSDAEPMKFEFSGDDDVWVFIDDVLVLDIGGIHSELYGTIDFSTGDVEIGQSWRTNGDIDAAHELFASGASTTNEAARVGEQPDSHVNKTNLLDLFKAAGKQGSVGWNGNTFSSNSTHKLKMFYLERGNYDSSLKLRFNLQTPKPHEIIKVDQNGDPLANAEFELYPAHATTLEQDPHALGCLNATEATLENPIYVAQTVNVGTQNQPLATLTTGKDGTATFMEPVSQPPANQSGGFSTEEEQRPFNFADRYETDVDGKVIGQYYILRETGTPAGYRSLPQDIVLEYNPETTMLKVANRWSTGAHASFTSTVVGIKNPAIVGGATSADPAAATATVDDQKNGLVVAVPALTKTPETESDDWAGVYGTNLDGFHTIKREDGTSEKENLLKAALYQAYLTLNQDPDSALQQQRYLEWNDTNDRLEGVLRNLPGSAERYALLNDENADLKMNYYLIQPEVFPSTPGEDDKKVQTYPTPSGKYHWLGTLVQDKLTEQEAGSNPTDEQITDAVNEVMNDFKTKNNDPALSKTSLLNTGDFSRTFRSLIYIPNEQRELRIQKIDQNGDPVENAEFALYDNAQATGTPVARGVTDENGQLVFMPRPLTDENGAVSQGYAQVTWKPASDNPQYYLRETRTPAGHVINNTIVPVVVGTYGIYADAGSENDGVRVMAGVGKLTQTMVKYASDGEINVTLQDITSICQKQPSGQFTQTGWQNDLLKIPGSEGSSSENQVPRSMNLHYGINQVVDYGLHDEDGGKTIRPFFVTDTGFIRSYVIQNLNDLATRYPEEYAKNATRRDKLGKTDLTPLFSLLNTVVITDRETNPEPTGELEISKTVVAQGNITLAEDDYNKLFTFTVQLQDADGNPLTGEYQYYGTDKSGTIKNNGTVMLHHDERITILGLPAGTQYRVTESEEADWSSIPANREISGEIIANQKSSAHFLNTKGNQWTTVALSVTKYVLGNINPNEAFLVTVTLTPPEGTPAISGTYGEMKFNNNRATFELSHNKTLTAWSLPPNTQYTVEETNAKGHTVRYEGETGTLTTGTLSQAFIYNTAPDRPNNPDDPDLPSYGRLQITKMVPGSNDTNTEFGMQVTLSGTGSRINGTYGDLQFVNGVATFTLTNGESKTATNLPAGVRYSVTETDAKGYRVYYRNQEGTITRNQTAEVIILNYSSTTNDTGRNLIVQKRWVLDNGGTRTNSVTVQLLRNGQVYSEATLNGRNNWAYTWENLDEDATWTVRENNVPPGFTSSVSHVSNFWIVTNDDNDPSSVGPGTSGSQNNTTNNSNNTNNRSNPPTATKTDFLKWGVTMAGAGAALLWVLEKKKNLKK